MRFYRQAITALINGTGLLVDSYAPQLCLFCDQPSHRVEPICDVCRGSLVPNRGACPRCALPDCGGAPCPRCQERPPRLRIVAPFVYEQAMSYLLRRWKYDGERRLGAAIGALAVTPTPPQDVRLAAATVGAACPPLLPADRLSSTLPAAIALCGPRPLALATPLHWRRRLQRGFNQSEDLLRAASQRCPELARARERARGSRLLRRRATARQATAARRDRLRNLQGAFLVAGAVSDRPILLVDDVCTTGATGVAMATALCDAGARSVTLWCLARTP